MEDGEELDQDYTNEYADSEMEDEEEDGERDRSEDGNPNEGYEGTYNDPNYFDAMYGDPAGMEDDEYYTCPLCGLCLSGGEACEDYPECQDLWPGLIGEDDADSELHDDD